MTVANNNTLKSFLSITANLDLSRHLQFLTDFQSLLENRRPKRNDGIMVTTTRFMVEQVGIEEELSQAESENVSGLFSFIAKKRKTRQIKNRLAAIVNKIMAWVTSTLDFFSIQNVLTA